MQDKMPTIQPADTQPNDQFGYSCYTLVLPVSEELVKQVDMIRREAGMERAAIPAHVTAKGTFFGVDSLDEVKRRVGGVTEKTQPFDVSFEGATHTWWEAGGGLSIPVTPPLQTLHDALVADITPLGTPAYQDDPYQPHMTYVQDMTPEGLQRVQDLVAQMNFGAGFRATAVDLMGRIGPAVGGRWQLIKRYELHLANEPRPQVGIGSHVEVELIDEEGNGEMLAFDLVAEGAADFDHGLLGAGSPLGQALRGKFAGSVVAYAQGDIRQVRILTVEPSQVNAPADAAARRQAVLEEARRKAERTNADMFASSFSGKWGDYDTDEITDP